MQPSEAMTVGFDYGLHQFPCILSLSIFRDRGLGIDSEDQSHAPVLCAIRVIVLIL